MGGPFEDLHVATYGAEPPRKQTVTNYRETRSQPSRRRLILQFLLKSTTYTGAGSPQVLQETSAAETGVRLSMRHCRAGAWAVKANPDFASQAYSLYSAHPRESGGPGPYDGTHALP